MDAISEERLTQVHPLLALKVRAMADKLAAQGIIIRVVQGLRSIDEQDALFHKIPKVTNAAGGHSWHNFGLAVDTIPGIRGVSPWKPNFDSKSPDYATMIAAGIAEGLISGSCWVHMPDKPHFQLPGIPVSPGDSARTLIAAHGLSGVWRTLVREVA